MLPASCPVCLQPRLRASPRCSKCDFAFVLTPKVLSWFDRAILSRVLLEIPVLAVISHQRFGHAETEAGAGSEHPEPRDVGK